MTCEERLVGLNERERVDTGVPVVEPGVGDVIERDAGARPSSVQGARDVETGAELHRTTQVDIAVPRIDPDGEPGGETPVPRDVEVAAQARVTKERILGRGGHPQYGDEREPSTLAGCPGARGEPVLETDSGRRFGVAHVERPDPNVERT